MIYAIYIVLILVSFLIILNGFLRGAKKGQIDAILSILLIVLVIASFFFAGWKGGFLAIVVAFISAIITRPVAARIASKLLASSTGGRGTYVGLPPQPLQRISQKLGNSLDPNKIMKDILSGKEQDDNAEEAFLDYCEKQLKIQDLLKEFSVSRNDLQELYHKLIMAGAGQWTCGHWIPASALAYPESLRYILSRKEDNFQETAFNLIMYFEQGSPLQS